MELHMRVGTGELSAVAMVVEDCCSMCSEAVPQDQARLSPPCHSVSILVALKAPKASVLTRKRMVDCNPPPKGKRRARGAETLVNKL